MSAGGAAAGPCLLARTAAVVAVACAVLHAGTAGGAAALAVGLACLTCAVHLWRRPGPVAWGTHVVLAVGMAAHPFVAAALPATGHVHGGGTSWATAASLLAGAGLLLAAWRWWLRRDLVV
ncbi:hypothetical protein [Geodermatophilus sp. CPCC 205761]|uniref:hypothetical protein n=1 Tax=Geodermatophilus sp. CPCC 205761 TaxID=2936597 RepID=UPI003EED5056